MAVVDASQGAIVIVNPVPKPPTITQQPKPQQAQAGANVTFTVTLSGTTTIYAWRKDGAAIPGATNATVQLHAVTSQDTGKYGVLVTNLVGSSLSAEVALTVILLQPQIPGGVVPGMTLDRARKERYAI